MWFRGVRPNQVEQVVTLKTAVFLAKSVLALGSFIIVCSGISINPNPCIYLRTVPLPCPLIHTHGQCYLTITTLKRQTGLCRHIASNWCYHLHESTLQTVKSFTGEGGYFHWWADMHGNPLHYSCLENPHGQRSVVGYSPWGHKESDTTEQLRIDMQGSFSLILQMSIKELRALMRIQWSMAYSVPVALKHTQRRVCVGGVCSCSIMSNSLRPHGQQPARLLYGIFQARISEWVAISSYRTHVSCVSCIAGGFLPLEQSGKPTQRGSRTLLSE